MCSCDIINIQQFSVTCLDNTTANITIVFQSYENNTAQSMNDSVVNYMLGRDHPAVVYLQSGWVVCLNVNCEWRFDTTSVTMVDNPTTTIDESDNDKLIPLVVGLVVGLLLVVAISLLCIIVICRKKSRLVQKLRRLTLCGRNAQYENCLEILKKVANAFSKSTFTYIIIPKIFGILLAFM